MAMERSEDSAVVTRRPATREETLPSFVEREHGYMFASEMLRNSQPPKPEEKLSVFWRVFGGTILSITALVVINAYQSLNSSISELRSDQNRLREHAADYVKKDEFSNRQDKLWNGVRELQGVNANLTVTTTKLAATEHRLVQAETERKELQKEVQALRERIAKLEGTKPVSDGK